MSRWIFSISLVFLFLIACGDFSSSSGEDYGDIFETEEGIVLTEGEHAVGWGQAECLICHNLNNIHLLNRSSRTDIDIDEIREDAKTEWESRGSVACTDCHGPNGVSN